MGMGNENRAQKNRPTVGKILLKGEIISFTMLGLFEFMVTFGGGGSWRGEKKQKSRRKREETGERKQRAKVKESKRPPQ